MGFLDKIFGGVSDENYEAQIKSFTYHIGRLMEWLKEAEGRTPYSRVKVVPDYAERYGETAIYLRIILEPDYLMGTYQAISQNFLEEVEQLIRAGKRDYEMGLLSQDYWEYFSTYNYTGRQFELMVFMGTRSKINDRNQKILLSLLYDEARKLYTKEMNEGKLSLLAFK